MRTAIISDIHGNYPALMKVLEDARTEYVDHYIFMGDYIFELPFSNEVVQVLMKMENAYIIKGNKEEYLFRIAKESQDNWIHDCWASRYQTFKGLKPEAYDFLHSLEGELYVPLNSRASAYVTHISPIFGVPTPLDKCARNTIFCQMFLEKPFTRAEFLADYHDFINFDNCLPKINNINANIIVYAHNHIQCHGYCGDKIIINPGSCGQPLDCVIGAPYTILEETSDGFNVIEKRVAYDVEAVIREVKASPFYEIDKISCEAVFMNLRTGRDYLPVLHNIALQISADRNEECNPFSNATWAEASEQFFLQYVNNCSEG